MNEEWKFVDGFNKDYAISNKGQVKSYHRKIIMSQQIVNGHKRVTLVKAGEKTHLYIHRLVAEHFVENPNNYRLVKHIDNNILNNESTNLMWVEYIDILKQERSPHVKKTFYMYDLNGTLLKTFVNLTEALEHLHKMGFDKANYSGIKKACLGGIKTYLGYVWKFEVNKESMSANEMIVRIKDIILSHEPDVVKLIKIDKLLFKGRNKAIAP